MVRRREVSHLQPLGHAPEQHAGGQRDGNRILIGGVLPAGQLLEHAGHGAAQTGGGDPPAGRAQGAARHVFARPRPAGRLAGQPEDDGREIAGDARAPPGARVHLLR